MPNWCYHYLITSAPSPTLDGLVEKHDFSKEGFLLPDADRAIFDLSRDTDGQLEGQMSYRFDTKWSPDPKGIMALAKKEGFTFEMSTEEHGFSHQAEWKWDGNILMFKELPTDYFEYDEDDMSGNYVTHDGNVVDNIFEFFDDELNDMEWKPYHQEYETISISKNI